MERKAPTFALGLILLAAASAAAAPKDAGDRELASALEASAVQPDGFERTADGSIARPGGPSDPDASGGAAARAANGLGRSSPGYPRSGRSAEAPPSLVGAGASRSSRGTSANELLGRGLAASLGVVLVLGLSLTHEAPASELLAESATRSFEPHGLTFGPRAAPAPVPAEPEPASAPARLVYRPAPRPSAGAPGPYVDTLMPVATWRAISQAEQQLIERWDLSREKALGAASLEDWLDRHAAAAGVDAARLKTKLHRDV